MNTLDYLFYNKVLSKGGTPTPTPTTNPIKDTIEKVLPFEKQSITETGTLSATKYRARNEITDITVTKSATVTEPFKNCLLLERATFETATSIPNGCFENCINLTGVTGGYVTTINDNAFDNCISLNYVNTPSLSKLGIGTFRNCVSLETLNAVNLSNISRECFFNCVSLKEIGDNNRLNVTTLGSDTFYNCYSLGKERELRLDNIATIGAKCFYNCTGLRSIQMGNLDSSVTSIGTKAFYNCTNLNELWIYGTTIPTLATDALYGTEIENRQNNARIFFQSELVEQAKADSKWGVYSDIIEPIP